jgi:arabinose-5-phosphate isomerase
MSEQTTEWLKMARDTLAAEAEAITVAASRLNGSLTRAVELILAHPGKIVVSGIGKSGHVGQKIVTTFCSTGTPAVFLHPAEAVHGDLGIYTPGDPVILISKSGTTSELLRLVPILRKFSASLIGILGNTTSPLADQVDFVLNASVRREADPHNLAPTSSAMVAMALGDALAVTLMHARQFTPEDFALFHPGGQLGRNLCLRVTDAMHDGEAVALVRPTDSLKQVVVAMTAHPLGAACVVNGQSELEGIITDGDLRRSLQAYDDIRSLNAAAIMTTSPTVIGPEVFLKDAVRLMEDRPSQISVLPVVDQSSSKCLGLIRLHDIYLASKGGIID